MTPESVRLLVGIRRRLRVAWALATAEAFGPVVAGAALALVVAGRLRPWPWPEPAALGMVAGAVLALAVAAVAVRITPFVAARAADRGLATGDAFTTALELDQRAPDGPFTDRVRERSSALAAGRAPGEAVPVRVHRRPMAIVGALGAAALALALTANAQDDVRRRRSAERAALAAEAEKLRQAAAEARTAAGSPEQEAVARRLEELARHLSSSSSIRLGQEALGAAAADLARRLSPDLLAQKAAVRGLDRSLSGSPLPGAANGTGAADQLRAAAAGLAGLTAEQRHALAERLAALAATQAAGNPQGAQELGRASGALGAGDLGAAASALEAAAGAQADAVGSVADQEAAAAALAAVAASSDALSQPGSGLGQGQGQGQGAGGGSGQGTNAPTGSGGQGGAGTPDGSGNNPSVGLQTATVYDPQPGTDGQQLNTTGQQGEGPSRVVGKADGPTVRNSAQVPVADVLPRYQAEATRALGQLNIPPSQRALVQAYFDALAQGRAASPSGR